MPPHDDEHAAPAYEDPSLPAEAAQDNPSGKSPASRAETGDILGEPSQMEALPLHGVRQQPLPAVVMAAHNREYIEVSARTHV